MLKKTLLTIIWTFAISIFCFLTNQLTLSANEGVNVGSVPSPPTNVYASSGKYSEYVSISWEGSPDDTWYEVYESDSIDGKKNRRVCGTRRLSCEVQTPICGTTYYFRIRSYNVNGPSEYSETVSGYRNCDSPLPPTSVYASDGRYHDKIRIHWEKSKDAKYYKIYRWENPEDERIQIATTAADYFDDTDAPCGLVYYAVVSSNSVGSGVFSNEDIGYQYSENCYPIPPQMVSASDGTYEDMIRISWKGIGNEESYDVYRSTEPISQGGKLTKIGTTSFAAFNDHVVSGDTQYYYRVKALNQNGTSKFSDFDTGYCTGPAFPSLGYAVDSPLLSFSTGGTTGWFWQNDEYIHGADAAQSGDVGPYQNSWLQTTVNGPGVLDFLWKTASGGGDGVLSFFIDGQKEDSISGMTGWIAKTISIPTGTHQLVWYFWNEKDNSETVNSAWLDKVVWTHNYVPEAPYIVVASEGMYQGKVNVTWSTSSNATSYDIYRAEKPVPLGGKIQYVKTVSGNSYSDNDIVPGTDYYYWVKAKNKYGASKFSGYDKGYAYISIPKDSADVTKIYPPEGASRWFGAELVLTSDLIIIGDHGYSENGIEKGAAFIFSKNRAGEWDQAARLMSESESPRNYFGHSVALYGQTAVVGSWRDSYEGDIVGSAYVFEQDIDGTWKKSTILRPENFRKGTDFGRSLAIGDNALIVGAPGDDDMGYNSGSVYVFTKNDQEIWSQADQLFPPYTGIRNFGRAIAISDNTLLVGGNNSGVVFVYELMSAGEWEHTSIIEPSSDADHSSFGYSFSLFENFVLISEPAVDFWSAFLFKRSVDGTWVQNDILQPPMFSNKNYFGSTVALSDELAVVQSNKHLATHPSRDVYGETYLFKNDGSDNWPLVSRIGATGSRYYDLPKTISLSKDYLAIAHRYGEDPATIYMYEIK